MRQSRRLALGVLVAVVVSLAVVASAAAAPKPMGTALPFTFTDGQTLTFAANTPFYLEHGVIGDATTKRGIAQLRDDTLNGFHFTIDGVAQTGTPVITEQDEGGGVTQVTHSDLTNFRLGLPVGTYTFVFTFLANGSVLFQETETYIFN